MSMLKSKTALAMRYGIYEYLKHINKHCKDRGAFITTNFVKFQRNCQQLAQLAIDEYGLDKARYLFEACQIEVIPDVMRWFEIPEECIQEAITVYETYG